MNNEPYLVISKIEIIKKTDTLITKLKEIKDDPMGREMERKKKYLIEELLLEMIKAGLTYTQFKGLYEKIFSYLESGENSIIQPKDVQKNVNRVVQFLEPASIPALSTN